MRREYITYSNDLPIKISYVNIKNYPIHWHNAIQIIYVLKGKISVNIDTIPLNYMKGKLKLLM